MPGTPSRSMTKSAVRVAREAMAVGQRTFPPYSHPHSVHYYTQPQLFALLVLKRVLRTDYRGLVTLVAEWSELRRALGLRERVPHYSTLCYAARRLLSGAEKGGTSPVLSTSSSIVRASSASSPRGRTRSRLRP